MTYLKLNPSLHGEKLATDHCFALLIVALSLGLEV
jgi:hypothetical protein